MAVAIGRDHESGGGREATPERELGARSEGHSEVEETGGRKREVEVGVEAEVKVAIDTGVGEVRSVFFLYTTTMPKQLLYEVDANIILDDKLAPQRSTRERTRSRSPARNGTTTNIRTRSPLRKATTGTPLPSTKAPKPLLSDKMQLDPPTISSSKPPTTNGTAALPSAVKPPQQEEDSDPEVAQMRALMGFAGFKSTKNTKVPGNNVGAVRKEKKTEYRQYMNRVGGFNRPLSPSR